MVFTKQQKEQGQKMVIKWKEKEDHTEQERDDLLRHYWPLAQILSRKKLRTLPIAAARSLDPDEFAAETVMVVPGCADRYQPDRDVKFYTYVVNRMRGQVIDQLRAADWLPRSEREKDYRIYSASMGLPYYEYKKTVTKISSANDLWDENRANSKLDSYFHTAKDETTREVDLLDQVKFLLRPLPERTQEIFRLYYCDGKSMKEIAAVMCLSDSRVSQLHSSALVLLRESEAARERQLELT
jgi:RNA polymerase sigma factor for flagellar operon FliA